MSLSLVAVLAAAVMIALLVLRRQGKSRPPAAKQAARSNEAVKPADAHGRRAEAKRSPKPVSEGPDMFRGGVLFPQKGACEAIMKLRGRTFLEGSVPVIPVKGCDRGACDCQVHQVVGRRRGPRRIQIERRADIRFNEERRTGQDRRKGGDSWNTPVD